MALNAKQKLFVKHYLKEKNATRAAKAAGYSKKTAHSVGPRMMENAGVKKAIDEGIAKQADKLEITADRVIKRIAEIAFAKDFFKKDSDILKACELLGKHFKLFTEVQEITGKDGGPQVILTLPSNGSEAENGSNKA